MCGIIMLNSFDKLYKWYYSASRQRTISERKGAVDIGFILKKINREAKRGAYTCQINLFLTRDKVFNIMVRLKDQYGYRVKFYDNIRMYTLVIDWEEQD